MERKECTVYTTHCNTVLSLRCCQTASTQVITYSLRPSPPPRPPRPALEWGGEAAGRGGAGRGCCTVPGYRWLEQARSVTDRDRAGIDCGGGWRVVRTGGGAACLPRHSPASLSSCCCHTGHQQYYQLPYYHLPFPIHISSTYQGQTPLENLVVWKDL